MLIRLLVQAMHSITPYAFREPIWPQHLQHGPQWVALTRAAALAAVHDAVMQPWFATFAGHLPRSCEFLKDGSALLSAVHALLQQVRASSVRKLGLTLAGLPQRLHACHAF
jgi:hypothetical protein